MDKNKTDEIEKILQDHGQYPQGLKEIGIPGRRDCDERYKMYALDDYISDDMTVIDIGCNCGFMSCLAAKKARYVVGIDKNKDLIKAANKAASALQLKNIEFWNKPFGTDFGTFEFVMALEIHHWVNMPFSSYLDIIDGTVRPGGFFLFESHDLDNVDIDIDIKLKMISQRGYSMLHSGRWVEDPGRYFIPPRDHKKIPRLFALFKNDVPMLKNDV